MPPSGMTTRGNCSVLREQSNEERAVLSSEEGKLRGWRVRHLSREVCETKDSKGKDCLTNTRRAANEIPTLHHRHDVVC